MIAQRIYAPNIGKNFLKPINKAAIAATNIAKMFVSILVFVLVRI